MLADRLQLTATESEAIAPNRVQLTIGTDLRAAQYLTGSSPSTPTTPVTTATGTKTPAPTDLTEMAGANTPCVK